MEVNFERVQDCVSDAERVILLSKESFVKKIIREAMLNHEEKRIFHVLDEGIEKLHLSY